jgi:hypothetical protein
MEPILSIRENVSQLQAERLLRSWRVGLRRIKRLSAIAAVYVPYRLHRVEITNNGRTEARLLAIDGVEGSLDLYGFPTVPAEEELITVSTPNRLLAVLDEATGRNLLAERVRRMCFRRGFFRVRNLRITVSDALEFYVPYWVGFYGSDNDLSTVALNAVRRSIEGRKFTLVVRNWLAAPSYSPSTVPTAVPLSD